MAYLDDDFNFIRVNKAYAEADGKEISFFPGKNHFDLYPNQENEKIFENVVKSGEPFFIRGKPFIYPDNPEKGVTYWDWSLIPIKEPKDTISSLVFTLRDVTDREVAKQKLKESNKRTNFYKDLLAHDIRNILYVIQTSAELMKKIQKNPKLTIKKKDLRERIIKQVEKGASLISKVQKLSDAEKEERVIKSVDIKRILNETISMIHTRFNDNQLIIEKNFPDESLTVKGGELLSDAFENILMNGILHNPSDEKKLWVTISRIQEANRNYIKLEVEDNAGGISKRDKENIFKRGSMSSNSKNMGIGLSLVKEIIDGYNGQVWVENRKKDDYTKGSNFVILLKEA